MMQGKAGRYLARVGNWVEDPEWVWLKLYLDKKKNKKQKAADQKWYCKLTKLR